jgi:NAD(P)-dependent dehydrogenase (short-subunit alcohol dehydrogenase family)
MGLEIAKLFVAQGAKVIAADWHGDDVKAVAEARADRHCRSRAVPRLGRGAAHQRYGDPRRHGLACCLMLTSRRASPRLATSSKGVAP